jgi:hypothetical protein
MVYHVAMCIVISNSNLSGSTDAVNNIIFVKWMAGVFVYTPDSRLSGIGRSILKSVQGTLEIIEFC